MSNVCVQDYVNKTQIKGFPSVYFLVAIILLYINYMITIGVFQQIVSL